MDVWREAVDDSSGRIYYYNTTTSTSQWDKPMALMTSAEILAFQQEKDSLYRGIKDSEK